jgi:hypothetical protein
LLAALEFKLHRVIFLRILRSEEVDGSGGARGARGLGGGTGLRPSVPGEDVEMEDAEAAVGAQAEGSATRALQYMRAHMQGFAGTHAKQLQRLMGMLVYAGAPGIRSPYGDVPVEAPAALGREFVRLSCRMAGHASQSPLAVCVAAGTLALPKLSKLADNLQKMKKQSWTACEQLPVEIELGPEFIYRSIFACPVSKEQSTPQNPPMLLPCGHVLCRDSVFKIAKGASRNFKCPYCPHDTHPSQCVEITF